MDYAKTEPAAISARLGGERTQFAAEATDRPQSILQSEMLRLAELVERLNGTNYLLANLGDRAYGEDPRNAAKSDDVRKAPPYSGQLAELYYVIDRLDAAVERAAQHAQRLDPLA